MEKFKCPKCGKDFQMSFFLNGYSQLLCITFMCLSGVIIEIQNAHTAAKNLTLKEN